MVVADTREIARSACELIQVDYEVLPPITNPIEAIQSNDSAVWGTRWKYIVNLSL